MSLLLFLFFFNDTSTTEIYTLSLHDALPIYRHRDLIRGHPVDVAADVLVLARPGRDRRDPHRKRLHPALRAALRSEEHTSELQSLTNLVCRLLLEKKKKNSHT